MTGISCKQILKQSLTVAIILLLISTSTGCAHSKVKEQAELLLDQIAFSPDFVIVREKNPISIQVIPTENRQTHKGQKLWLEQQLTLPSGDKVFKPLSLLHDDGKKGDLQADDNIFSARIQFYEEVTGSLIFRIVSKQDRKQDKRISRQFSLPVNNACGPTGTILPINIINKDFGKEHIIQFEVPGSPADPRETILRIVNGSQVGAPIKSRIKHAVITLNNEVIQRVHKLNNVTERLVSLNPGTNTLLIKQIRAQHNQSLALEIQACADQISLAPITDTLKVGELLTATATVTAQGLPVSAATVNFEISEALAPEREKSALTSDNGVAESRFVISQAGNASLSASVAGAEPSLTVSTPLASIAQPTISLNQGFQEITIEQGQSESLPFFLFYTSKDLVQRHLIFERTINPNNGGLIIAGGQAPAGGQIVNGPASFSFKPTVTAINTGDYTVTALATVTETGETSSTTTQIHVVSPGAPDPLTLNQPGFTPAGILPATATPVTVRALATGTSTPPDRLWLDEVDKFGNLISAAIAELKDDGNNADKIAQNQLFTAQFLIIRDDPQPLYFRIRADYFGKEVLSASTLFSVSPFDLQSPPADLDQLIDDGSPEFRIFANEVIAKLLPETSPDRAATIAASIDGQIISIIPELQTYRIRFTSDGTLASIENAIATLNSFLEVVNVSKNSEVTIAGTNCNWSDPSANCPQDPLYTGGQQWHLDKIRAKEAWLAAQSVDTLNFAGSAAYPVAVIDFGVDCNHTELNGHCLPLNGNADTHGTKVAGIIAAEANTQGGVGVAWNSNIISFIGGNNLDSVAAAMITASNSDAMVLNISTVTLTNNISTIQNAACAVVDKGKLIVAAAGQRPAGSDGLNYYPAALNADSTFTCNMANLSSHFIAVGASNPSDELATWSVSGISFKSNPVNWIDLYAPGTDIVAFSSSEADRNGTSYAAPQVSAAAAMLWPLLAVGTDAATLHNRLLVTAVEIGNIDGVGGIDKRLDIRAALGTNKMTINFVNESADFRNTFGVYNRTTRQARILIDNVDLQSNPDLSSFETVLFLSDQDLANLEFFLIPNGAVLNATYLQSVSKPDRSLEVFQDTDNKWRLRDTETNTILRGAVGEADALFSEPARNPDPGREQIQKIGPVSNYALKWEDRPASTSDNDYNDAEFRITLQ